MLLAQLFFEPIFSIQRGKGLFLEQLHLVGFPNKVVSELGYLEFFLCTKMDDDMIKLNLMNYSTWKHMMEDLLYFKVLYKPIRLKEKPLDTLDDD